MASVKSGDGPGSITVSKEDSRRVEVAIKIRGLKPKKGLSKLLSSKRDHPQNLVKNATFTRWNFTSSSLEYELQIHNRQHGTQEPTISRLHIRRFPSEIEDLKVDVRQPPHDRSFSFLFISGRKRQPATDWKQFATLNSTIDAGTVDEESLAQTSSAQAATTTTKETEPDFPRRDVYQKDLKKDW